MNLEHDSELEYELQKLAEAKRTIFGLCSLGQYNEAIALAETSEYYAAALEFYMDQQEKHMREQIQTLGLGRYLETNNKRKV